MATLNETMNEIADAIREKTGKSELIAPINFAEEIKSISASGGESGGSNMEYLDLRAVDSEIKMLLLNLSFLSKIPQNVEMGGGNISATIDAGVSPSAGWGAMFERYKDDAAKREIVLSAVTACSISLSTDVIIMGQFITINDIFTMYGMSEYIDSIPRITKEQFYDLNA